MKLSSIETVDLREVWKSESSFNKWLADKGINLLAEELSFENLEVISTEVKVGDFYADIVARTSDLEGNKIMVIESQLTPTDHDHLGKLLTYSSVLDANYVIWISPHVREEHRKAIDWLNEIAESSDRDIGFFLIKIELWKIETSPPAPKFSVVSSPNNWAKGIKAIPSKKLGKKAELSYRFLIGFYEYLSRYLSSVKPPSVSTPSMYEFHPFNTSKAYLRIGVNISQKYLRIGIVFEKNLFENFKKYENHLKDIFKDEEVRIESPESYKKSAYADVFKRDVDLHDEEKWPENFKWLYDKYEKLKNFFEDYRKELFGES